MQLPGARREFSVPAAGRYPVVFRRIGFMGQGFDAPGCAVERLRAGPRADLRISLSGLYVATGYRRLAPVTAAGASDAHDLPEN